MKIFLLKNILPPLAGLSGVVTLLILYNIFVFDADFLQSPDNGFFSVLVPIALVAGIIVQKLIISPAYSTSESGNNFQLKCRKILCAAVFVTTAIFLFMLLSDKNSLSEMSVSALWILLLTSVYYSAAIGITLLSDKIINKQAVKY
jgi:hypothetical protein